MTQTAINIISCSFYQELRGGLTSWFRFKEAAVNLKTLLELENPVQDDSLS